MPAQKHPIAHRFRGFLPVVIDVETAGFRAKTDALLELAAVVVHMDDKGMLYAGETVHYHIDPFPGANLDAAALKFIGIDPFHPFRMAISEEKAISQLFEHVQKELRKTGCHRAVLVGHNPSFDMGFIKAAVKRLKIKRMPFHSFTLFDTATLSGLAFGQTVLARAIHCADISFDPDQAHSALYDTQKTAELFCYIMNQWQTHVGVLKPTKVQDDGDNDNDDEQILVDD